MTTIRSGVAACLPHGATAVVLSFILGALSPALADRVIVDQLGREVTIPDTIDRAVVLQHHTLDVIVQLDAQDQVVGVVRDWEGLLGKGFERLASEFKDLSAPGELTTVNLEELLSLEPEVVFITHYAPEGLCCAKG